MSEVLSGAKWQKLDREQLERYYKILRPRHDDDVGEVLVKDRTNGLWFLNTVGRHDPQRRLRERFVYLLGHGHVNVAEVKLISEALVTDLQASGIEKATSTCHLVRLAEECLTSELACGTLDTATSAELVFSVWLRRRDAHSANRGYNPKGIPVCFDFGVAFCKDGRPKGLQDFFGREEPGDAGTWRVHEAKTCRTPITTEALRTYGKDHGVHWVESWDAFELSARRLASVIAEDKRDFEALAGEAGLTKEEVNRLAEFLREGQGTILADTEYMLHRLRDLNQADHLSEQDGDVSLRGRDEEDRLGGY